MFDGSLHIVANLITPIVVMIRVHLESREFPLKKQVPLELCLDIYKLEPLHVNT